MSTPNVSPKPKSTHGISVRFYDEYLQARPGIFQLLRTKAAREQVLNAALSLGDHTMTYMQEQVSDVDDPDKVWQMTPLKSPEFPRVKIADWADVGANSEQLYCVQRWYNHTGSKRGNAKHVRWSDTSVKKSFWIVSKKCYQLHTECTLEADALLEKLQATREFSDWDGYKEHLDEMVHDVTTSKANLLTLLLGAKYNDEVASGRWTTWNTRMKKITNNLSACAAKVAAAVAKAKRINEQRLALEAAKKQAVLDAKQAEVKESDDDDAPDVEFDDSFSLQPKNETPSHKLDRHWLMYVHERLTEGFDDHVFPYKHHNGPEAWLIANPGSVKRLQEEEDEWCADGGRALWLHGEEGDEDNDDDPLQLPPLAGPVAVPVDDDDADDGGDGHGGPREKPKARPNGSSMRLSWRSVVLTPEEEEDFKSRCIWETGDSLKILNIRLEANPLYTVPVFIATCTYIYIYMSLA